MLMRVSVCVCVLVCLCVCVCLRVCELAAQRPVPRSLFGQQGVGGHSPVGRVKQRFVPALRGNKLTLVDLSLGAVVPVPWCSCEALGAGLWVAQVARPTLPGQVGPAPVRQAHHTPHTTQHNTKQHDTTHTTQHNTTQHNHVRGLSRGSRRALAGPTFGHSQEVAPGPHSHLRGKAIQHNTTQHNTTPHHTTQHNTTQHHARQHNTTQHNTTIHNNVTMCGGSHGALEGLSSAPRSGTARNGPPVLVPICGGRPGIQHNTTQKRNSTAQHNTTPHHTTPRHTAQQSTRPRNTTQHNTT
jgi:hypothetical protein